jgi:hypothetical protein
MDGFKKKRIFFYVDNHSFNLKRKKNKNVIRSMEYPFDTH